MLQNNLPVFFLEPILPEADVLLPDDLHLHDHLVMQLYHELMQLAQVSAHLLPLLGQLLRDTQYIPETKQLLHQ